MAIFNKNTEVADVSVLVKRIQTLGGNIDAATGEIEHLQLDLEQTQAKRDAAAADNDRKGYDKLSADVDRLKGELDFKQAAHREAIKQRATAEAELRVATTADREKDGKKLGTQNLKDYREIADCYARIYSLRQGIHNRNTKALSIFPDLALNHTGCLIAPEEIQRALEIEIARISHPGPLPAPDAPPALPGAASFIFGGNPAAAEPLTDLVEKANAELVKRVVGFVDDAPKAEAKPAPAPINDMDPDAAILATPSVDAASVQASIQPRKLT